MPHAIRLNGTQIIGYDPSKAQPLPADWQYVNPVQYVAAQAMQYPNYVDGEVVNIEPPPPELVIPTQITMRQARLILLQYGLLDAVNGIIAGLPQSYQIEWEYAQYADRSNPLIGMVATAGGMTTEQIDAMFVAGSEL